MRSGPNTLLLFLAAMSVTRFSDTLAVQSVTETPNIMIVSEGLLPAYTLLIQQSAIFRAAVDELNQTGFEVVIGYHDDFEPSYRLPVLGGLAQVKPLFHDNNRLYGVHIVFYTRDMEASARAAGITIKTITRELAIILAHELYGHVVPAARVRMYPSPCADPAWEMASQEKGCAVERENQIRNEIGFGERPRYGFVDLSFFCVSNEGACRAAAPHRVSSGQQR